jgi:hypothetical protein
MLPLILTKFFLYQSIPFLIPSHFSPFLFPIIIFFLLMTPAHGGWGVPLNTSAAKFLTVGSIFLRNPTYRLTNESYDQAPHQEISKQVPSKNWIGSVISFIFYGPIKKNKKTISDIQNLYKNQDEIHSTHTHTRQLYRDTYFT